MSAPLLARRLAAALALALAGCQAPPAEDAAKQASEDAPSPSASSDSTAAEPSGTPDASGPSRASTLERLFTYLPSEVTAVAYDRLGERLDPAVIEVVFALPPKTADLLDERALLDEGLDIVLDGDADPGNWLAPTSLGFTLPAANATPFFLRPLTKPAAELAPLLEQGFAASETDGVPVWLPTGSFPWRIAILDDAVAAFIPIGTVGTGVDVLLAAKQVTSSEVESQLVGVLGPDPALELVLVSGHPVVHLDVDQPIAQVQFGLRKLADGYEGQVVLAPTGDVDDALAQLRARKHPEENLQVQALLGAVEFIVDRGGVMGRLVIGPDQVKHLREL